MRILSLETATYFGGVAFASDDARGALGPFAPRESSRQVLAAAQTLLTRHACDPGDLDAVAVSTGPGLFTGVRVGLSIAKTLIWAQAGEARRAALVGVPTLEAVAFLVVGTGTAANGGGIPAPGDIVIPVTDARRGEVYTAAFEIDGAGPPGLSRLSDDLVVRPGRLAARLFATADAADRAAQARAIWLVGDGVDSYGESLMEQFGDRARAAAIEGRNLALEVAELGRARFEAGETQAPEDLKPHYVRRPDARLPAAPFASRAL